MFRRLLGVVYAVAFLVAANQILPLIASDGLLPLDNFVREMRAAFGGSLGAFFRLPSIFFYRYSFVRPNAQGLWWKRERRGLWLPPLDANDPDFKQLLRRAGWFRDD